MSAVKRFPCRKSARITLTTLRAAKADIVADAVVKTAIAAGARDRAVKLEKVAPEVTGTVIGRQAIALMTVAATVRTVRPIADRTQHRTMRPLPRVRQRSEWLTASNGRAPIVLIATTSIAASASPPISVRASIVRTANIARASSGRANVGRMNIIGQTSIATANIAPVSIGVNIAAIIAPPATEMHSALIAATHRPDVIATKLEPKATMRRRSRIRVAVAKAVPRGAAQMRRSS